MTLGSLFDGSGGFPLAGSLCGIQPLWASEIEPYPIAVTRSRFPHMQHLGSVTEIDGGAIPPVDIVAFGSPCQDMSVAGKRAGMQHAEHGADDTTRSGLFYEAVRIIKEMRESTNGSHPTFAVWENVPGAFSSNRGDDFRCVLQALQEVCGGGVSIPRPSDGRWPNSGEVLGDGCSIAWRVLDAKYWGVPQRRRRIYLVADFRGGNAGQVLFERAGLCGSATQSGEAGQGAAADAPGGTGRGGGAGCLNPWDIQSGRLFDPSGVFHTLQACGRSGQQQDGVVIALHIQQDPISSESVTPCIGGQGQATAGVVYAIQGNAIDRADTAGCNGCGWREGACYTLNAVDGPAIAFMDKQGAKARSIGASENCSPTLKACSSGVPSVVFPTIARTLTAEADGSPCVDRGQNIVAIDRGECFVASSFGGYVKSNPTLRAAGGDLGGGSEGIVVYDARGNGNGTLVPTLTGDHGNRVTDYTALVVNSTGGGIPVCLPIDQHQQDARFKLCEDGIVPTLKSSMGTGGNNTPMILETARNAEKPPRRYIVRRLTPVECQRLQGFPDGWGALDKKAEMEDGEAEFWASVKKTYAEITKKRYAPYKRRSSLIKWYNKLHSDGAEYKMWGNGISLPCAVYVLQGIVRCAQPCDIQGNLTVHESEPFSITNKEANNEGSML